MSIKINALVPAAAAAAGVVIPSGQISAFPDALLSINQIGALSFAEIHDASGKVMAFANVVSPDGSENVRPVAGTDGNIKLYANASSALKLTKSTNLTPGALVTFAPYAKPASVGDPLASLEARYKASCAKGYAAQGKKAIAVGKLSTAVQFGWDTSSGATLAEYNDLVARVAVLTEWESEALALVDTLSARLTSVGVNPTTLGPRPTPTA